MGREALRHWDGFERLATGGDWLVRTAGGRASAWPCLARCGCFADADLGMLAVGYRNPGTNAPERHGDVIEVRLIGTIEASFPNQQMEANLER